MRKSLERLERKLSRIEVGYTADAICDLREIIQEILEHLDEALPKEVEPD